MNDKIKFIHASLLDILPHLPVRIIEEMHEDKSMKTERVITHATLHSRKERSGPRIHTYEFVSFHEEGADSKHVWWSAGNTRNALGGCVVFLTPQEAERIGVTAHAESKYPEWMLVSDTHETTHGDQRPAAYKSVQAIIYREDAHE